MEGVRIIEESYQPEVSKQFIRAEMNDRNGMWRPHTAGHDRVVKSEEAGKPVEKR